MLCVQDPRNVLRALYLHYQVATHRSPFSHSTHIPMCHVRVPLLVFLFLLTRRKDEDRQPGQNSSWRSQLSGGSVASDVENAIHSGAGVMPRDDTSVEGISRVETYSGHGPRAGAGSGQGFGGGRSVNISLSTSLGTSTVSARETSWSTSSAFTRSSSFNDDDF